MSPPAIRRLGRDDAAAFRDLRLTALRDHPDAFGAAFEEESACPIERFAERLEGGFVLGGGESGRLDGMAGVYVPKDLKARHKAHLWGIYVRPEARGTGLAQALILGCVEYARSVAEEVILGVATDNQAAVARYRSMGFEECGFEQRALKTGGRYYDEVLMAIRFV
ncbi:GNAT family N-acetyltransferase [Aureimonas leprariae]|uniref:GNAT family N-acetyltransferase n=1 Tax=Plantimonas leprariae TaxID=2615207 RepID=A0A7V7U1S6_9HYPH|nr:GNAT family N-acetyltransferase [Aureimonas leprariae]KAB0682613.1 GNAT family N-acetyltransferase [Aureimonas leprariae]